MEEEIKKILEEVIREHFPNVEFPDKIELELTNLPEPPPPPEPPKIEIPKVDLSGLENAIKQFLNKKQEVITPTDLTEVESLLEQVIIGLKDLPQPETIDHSEILGKILEKLGQEPKFEVPEDFFKDLRATIGALARVQTRPVQISGGGAIGPSKIFYMNSKGRAIDPAIAIEDGETLSTIDPQGTLIAGKVAGRAEDKAEFISSFSGGLGVFNLSDRELAERQTLLLELISLKLNCLQVDEITEDDIE